MSHDFAAQAYYSLKAIAKKLKFKNLEERNKVGNDIIEAFSRDNDYDLNFLLDNIYTGLI